MLATRDETQSERSQRRRQEQAWRARAEQGFHSARNAQATYGAQLRAFARQIARILEAFRPEEIHPGAEGEIYTPGVFARLNEALKDYGEAVEPWARSVAGRMLAEVERRDQTAWRAYTEGMGQALRQELANAPLGTAMQTLLAQQVDLITSLPTDAGNRVHEKTLAALEYGGRFPEQTAEVQAMLAEAHPLATQRWLVNRATLIARTETARTASVLVQTRSEHIGAESYVWRTAGDWKVRESHRKLNGRVFRWDEPPLSDPPDYHSHPGQIFNCRCVALPILPE